MSDTEADREQLIREAADDAITLGKVRESDRAWAEEFARRDIGAFVDYVLSAPKVSLSAAEQVLDEVDRRMKESGGRLDFVTALNEVGQERPDLGARHQLEMLVPKRVPQAEPEKVSHYTVEDEVLRRAKALCFTRDDLDIGAAMDEVLQADPALARAVKAERGRN